jgi:hypothetical protein
MISEANARTKILEAVGPLPPRKMSILEALNRFAAEDCFAHLPLPMFDNSAMDGYAVIASDCKRSVRLRVIGEQPAGVDRKLRVATGQAVRIFTGAPIPTGADAVVMQEDVTRNGDEIVVAADVDPGEFIRKRGCDLGEGQKILTKGDRITASKLGLLASQGFDEVPVGSDVRAGIVSTGDELAKPGKKLQPGQIYDSNSILLRALLEQCGAVVSMSEFVGESFSSGHEERNIDCDRRRFGRRTRSGPGNVAQNRREDRHLASGNQTRQAFFVRAVRKLLCLRFAGKSGIGVRDLFAVRASGNFENDGLGRCRSSKSARAIGCGS